MPSRRCWESKGESEGLGKVTITITTPSYDSPVIDNGSVASGNDDTRSQRTDAIARPGASCPPRTASKARCRDPATAAPPPWTPSDSAPPPPPRPASSSGRRPTGAARGAPPSPRPRS
eukprot:8364720-Pyramimonas_sp.AAC.1